MHEIGVNHAADALSVHVCRAPELFVECGTLRQLHTMLTRCLASYAVKYDAVIGKMLQVVKDLPFCPDDIWHTRNAQGTFADALRQLADVRLRARDVRDKVMLDACCFMLPLSTLWAIVGVPVLRHAVPCCAVLCCHTGVSQIGEFHSCSAVLLAVTRRQQAVDGIKAGSLEHWSDVCCDVVAVHAISGQCSTGPAEDQP